MHTSASIKLLFQMILHMATIWNYNYVYSFFLPVSSPLPTTRRFHSPSLSSSFPFSTTSSLAQRDAVSFFKLYYSTKISNPSQDEAEILGIREWPQQSKTKDWSEKTTDNQPLIRYILKGSGSLTIQDNENGSDGTVKQTRFSTGNLIEVDGPCSLNWMIDDDCDGVILLTPGFEQGGLFIGAIVAMVVMFGVLISGVAI
jgi:hypothetical protein